MEEVNGVIVPLQSLMVRLTHDCNMSCSFCHIAEDMKNKTKVDVSTVLAKYLYEKNFIPKSFSISGGEPLDDKEMMEKVLSEMLTYSTEIPITIFTNGSLLTSDYVNTFNSFHNVSTCISITGVNKGEKSLKNLIVSANGSHIVRTIASLDNKRIRYVIDDFKDDFELDVLSLVKIFNCRVELSLNFENLSNLDVSDAYYLEKTLVRFYELGISNMVGINGFFERDCDCRESKIITPSGLLEDKAHDESNDFSSPGCSYLGNGMPTGLYELFTRIIEANRALR